MINKKVLTLIFVVAFVTLLVGCIPQPTNQVPIITSDPVKTGEVGVEYIYDVNATDPEEDVLTYSLVTKPEGMTINSATGLIEWTPTAKGVYSVVVKVSDGDLDITQSFTITVIEEEPSPTPTKYYTITATAGDNGTIDPLGKVKVKKGKNETFTITPNTSYYIVDVLVDGVSVGAVGSYTFDNVTANHTIHATFKAEVKTITIRWLEDAIRYNADGDVIDNGEWFNNPIPGVGENKPAPYPATLIMIGGEYYFANVNEYFNWDMEYEGSIVIDGTGQLSGYATYISPGSGLPIEDHFEGDVKIIIGETINWSEVDPIPEDPPDDYDGVMVGTYTQWSYAYAESLTDYEILIENYPGAVLDPEQGQFWWFIGQTDYIAHGGKL